MRLWRCLGGIADKTGGGGGKYLRDSAFWLKTAIPAPRCVDRPQVLSSLRGLKNAVFSSKILESRSGKKNKHKLPNPTAGDFKLESTFLSSLRALAQDKAWQSIPHKSSPRTLESKRHKLHTSTYSLHIILESQAPLKSPTTLESTFEKTQMDCHADFQSARNDDENAQSSNTPPQTRANLDSSKSPCDSKILDEKCGLQGKSQGSYLSGDLWDFSQFPHFSLKAESPQAQKPTPKPLTRSKNG